MNRLHRLVFELALITVVIFPARIVPAQAAILPRVDLVLWHQQGEDTMQQLGIQKIFDDWAIQNSPGSTLTLVQKNFDDLGAEFLAPTANGPAPDVLWTTADQLYRFTAKDMLRPVDDMADMALFLPMVVESARVNGKVYGVPLQVGNFLMLFYNKKFIKTAPKTYAELSVIAQELIKTQAELKGFSPFAYHQWDSLWVFPVAHAFGAAEFDASGKVPTIDTEAWIKTYQFLYDLKFKDKIEPETCDYECADIGFKAGTVAITINGDWALDSYITALGDNLGIAAWPSVGNDPTKGIPAPFVVGEYLMIPAAIIGDKLTTAQAFVKFLATDEPTVLSWTVPQRRLPALTSALNSSQISSDPILSQTSQIMATGVMLPPQPEMQCVMAPITRSIRDVMNDALTAQDMAAGTQKTALECIGKLK